MIKYLKKKIKTAYFLTVKTNPIIALILSSFESKLSYINNTLLIIITQGIII